MFNKDELLKDTKRLWEEAFSLDSLRCEGIAEAALAPVGKIAHGVFCWSNLSVADLRRLHAPLFTLCLCTRGV